MSTTTKFPILKWSQRKDKLFITIQVVHTKKPTIEIEGNKMTYKGEDDKTKYAFEIFLYDEIDKEGSKYTLDSRNIFLNLKKKTSGPYWPRLTKDQIKLHWVEIDWAWFVEEDEEEESKGPDFAGQDFGDIGGEMDEDDEPDKAEHEHGHEHGHDHTHEHGEHCDHGHDDKPAEEKKPDLSDLDKDETK